MKTLVLKIKYGGLGDHLFYSHIPRIAKKTGAFDQVLISNLSEFRHPDYRRIVWEINPYLDGFSDDEGVYAEFSRVGEGENILDRIMLGLGIDDGIRFHEPELYFKPAMDSNLKESIVYDPNYISHVGWLHARSLRRYLSSCGIHIDISMRLREKYFSVPALRELYTPDIEAYCSVIVSCKEFYCLASGSATLAAALRKPAVVFWGEGQNRMFHHSKLHRYVLIGEPFSAKIVRQLMSLPVRLQNRVMGSLARPQ